MIGTTMLIRTNRSYIEKVEEAQKVENKTFALPFDLFAPNALTNFRI